jgi:hypothetical protein
MILFLAGGAAGVSTGSELFASIELETGVEALIAQVRSELGVGDDDPKISETLKVSIRLFLLPE